MDVGEYSIGTLCYHAYPCKHRVKHKDGQVLYMSGDEIYALLKKEGKSNPHFEKYNEYIEIRNLSMRENVQQTDHSFSCKSGVKKQDQVKCMSADEMRAFLLNDEITLILPTDTMGDYEIEQTCFNSTYPCKHWIKYKKRAKLMTGDKIYTLLKNKKMTHTHFEKYGEYIRKRDFPTPQEMEEQEQERERLLKRQQELHELEQEQERKKQKWMREYEEKQAITNKYKASTMIEKLKAKHNIKC